MITDDLKTQLSIEKKKVEELEKTIQVEKAKTSSLSIKMMEKLNIPKVSHTILYLLLNIRVCPHRD